MNIQKMQLESFRQTQSINQDNSTKIEKKNVSPLNLNNDFQDLEKQLLMSPSWKHRQEILVAEPFNIFEENLDNDLKKINK